MTSPTPSTPSRSVVVSVSAHAFVLLALFGVFHFGPSIAPYRLPGTALGVRSIPYYSPGSVAHTPAPPASKPLPEAPTHTSAAHAPAPPAPATPAGAEAGAANAALSGRGQGDISIALQKVFPYPTVHVPHGTHGDVILNAVIDEHGAISQLTLISGLGPAIDDQVIATVRDWTYTPATRNGIPVPSEQELRFHYDRS